MMSQEPRVCPACGAEQAPEARFCVECGQSLDISQDQTMVLTPQAPEPAPVAAPAPPPPPPPPAPAPVAETFASAPPPPPPPPPTAVAPKKGSLAPLVIILAALFLLFALGGAFVAVKIVKERMAPKVEPALPAPSTVLASPPAEPEVTPPAPTVEPPATEPAPATQPDTSAAPGTSSAPATSEDEAIDRVMARSDVKEWQTLIDQAQASGKRTKAMIQVEGQTDESYTVHVYESIEDPDFPHTATFGWFRVDKATGAVTQFVP
jgi:hypothetical protein